MSKIPGSAHMNMGVGGLTILGGVAGFARKRSKASLVAGLGVGSMLLGSSYLIVKTDQIYEAHLLGTTAGGILALGMGKRFVSTRKVMPAGLVMALGAVTCAYNFNKAQEWKPT
ncbi:predicted protein [Phaeodactylum tricornutum CCAP 1055/1]|uniref:Transmembrane protein 14 n=2 Tax=Phaeodactylum tricornutum TaxID=2850 RepID=B7FXF3_PHATC|nr:predicted protein [Phaeodactylum tricornutum CCAP 1055/1]EEC49370.1 predicted protein [Phaeodactylum tricornutum CCAP 1055/1]|eukprot:XP_002179547.1 predicted protein [Phaeodactylum tricornutum CCAP 1055/1]